MDATQVQAQAQAQTHTDGWTDSSSGAGDTSGGVTAAPVPHSLLYGVTTTTVDNHATAESSTAAKRGRPAYPYYVTGATTAAWPASPPAVVPRCQVEGCHVALGNVKEYYRKHKVCEIHSKAPKVVVLGRVQRFCQQCSRFHGVTEFDEAKRSCRRRLKGHNQRRRKGTLLNPHSMTVRRLGPPSPSPSPSPATPGCALSFLSSPVTDSWNFSGDFSLRSGAAVVYELMAANRGTSVLGHLLNQNDCDQSVGGDYTLADTQMWDRLGSRVDLKQSAALEFGVLTAKEKSRDAEEWTDYCWSTFGDANVV